ncbi:MAG: MBL fold metallo-hydrolase [Clostridia bacterium]|nr:MBL fold metallo-hydrolase [Clostridia bacterium]
MLLLPDLYQVAGPSLSHSFDASAYLLPCGDEAYLIDCGTREGFELIVRNIEALGFNPGRVTRIYATHGHYDHVGGAALFRRQYASGLFLHALDAPQVENGDSVKTTAALLYGVEAEPIKTDGRISEGDTFTTDAGRWTVLHTPGHSPGSCCFVLEHVNGTRLLIAGDTLHGGCHEAIGSDIGIWKESLKKLTSLHFDYYHFGHVGAQLLCDADRRIASLAASFANYYSPWFKDFYRSYPY